ncbi:MAG TPA: hypothetical protein VIM10_04705 [Actinopolymorphaceae bacterium]|jgi:hypothetical protein
MTIARSSSPLATAAPVPALIDRIVSGLTVTSAVGAGLMAGLLFAFSTSVLSAPAHATGRVGDRDHTVDEHDDPQSGVPADVRRHHRHPLTSVISISPSAGSRNAFAAERDRAPRLRGVAGL